MTRAAYWQEFNDLAITTGMAKVVLDYQLIQVREPVRIQVRWKENRVRKPRGQDPQIVWVERQGVTEYLPGKVLRCKERPAVDWEVEEWRNLSDEELQRSGIYRQGNHFSIQIVEQIKDLPAAVRQRQRHILASEIGRTRRSFVLGGNAQQLASYASQLNLLVQRFLQDQGSDQILTDTSKDLARLTLRLERSRSELKKSALDEIVLAQQQGRMWEVAARTSQAAAFFLQERARAYETAVKSLELAEVWLRLLQDIERRFRNCYRRLGQLGQRLQNLIEQGQGQVSPDQLLAIAREAHGIWLHLMERVPNFDPYYSRLQEPEFQRLSRVLEHAQAGRASTVYNDIEQATSKLEAIAMKERPTIAELAEERARLL